ncbi:MAG: hypothetical protein RMI32_07285 [Candidatus Nitrosocaldus sp.]|nr:hypothetical protein [Candidatus Nitrosocaldus sp.]
MLSISSTNLTSLSAFALESVWEGRYLDAIMLLEIIYKFDVIG